MRKKRSEGSVSELREHRQLTRLRDQAFRILTGAVDAATLPGVPNVGAFYLDCLDRSLKLSGTATLAHAAKAVGLRAIGPLVEILTATTGDALRHYGILDETANERLIHHGPDITRYISDRLPGITAALATYYPTTPDTRNFTGSPDDPTPTQEDPCPPNAPGAAEPGTSPVPTAAAPCESTAPTSSSHPKAAPAAIATGSAPPATTEP